MKGSCVEIYSHADPRDIGKRENNKLKRFV